MAEKLLNTFLLGADPEMVVLDPPKIINAERVRQAQRTHYGYDHGGFVVEPHPTPALSARSLCANIKKSLDVMSDHFAAYKFRAGAYFNDPDIRHVTLGGHVHLDIPTLTTPQLNAMDIFCESLEELDILPAAECKQRSQGGIYGRKSDIRAEHGHVEYRSMCSWLFSRKTTMLCVTGIKLAAVAPQTLTRMTSISALQKWLEGFKGADDDVDWILERGYFDTSMEAKPDANVKAVWKVDPSKAKEWIEEAAAWVPTNVVVLAEMERRILAGGMWTTAEYTEIRRRAQEGSEGAYRIWRRIREVERTRTDRLNAGPAAGGIFNVPNAVNALREQEGFQNALQGILGNNTLDRTNF